MSGFKYCNWDEDPPKNGWDLTRRSILEFVEMAERQLAQLHSLIGECPLDKEPTFEQNLKMIESAAEAARHARDCDDAARNWLKTVQDRVKPPL